METRKQFVEKCINECLELMFKYSYPSISFKEHLELAKLNNVKESLYDKHYLPDKLYEEIIQNFCEVYGFKYYYRDSINHLLNCLKEGGYRNTYIKDTDESPGYRSSEKTPKLEELIGKEHSKSVINLIKDLKDFYRFDTLDRDRFYFNVMNFSPTSNRESVNRYWKDTVPDFQIPDDKEFFRNYYRDECGYSDEDIEYELKLIESNKDKKDE